jgi:hypothetical protein
MFRHDFNLVDRSQKIPLNIINSEFMDELASDSHQLKNEKEPNIKASAKEFREICELSES